MKDTLISYDTSVLAKDRGFDQECLFLYRKLIEGDVILTDHDLIGAWKIDVEGLFSNNTSPNEFLAPTQSLLAKWLRDEHGIYVYALPSYTDDKLNKDKFVFEIHLKEQLKVRSGIIGVSNYFKTHEEALEAGLQRALEMI